MMFRRMLRRGQLRFIMHTYIPQNMHMGFLLDIAIIPCIAMYRHVSPCIAMYHHVSPCIPMYRHVQCMPFLLETMQM